MANITFTYDLEEHLPNRQGQARYPAITEKVLGFLAGKNIQGTFYLILQFWKFH